MESFELLTAISMFAVQLLVKIFLDFDEWRFSNPRMGEALCKLYYVGPDLCVVAFVLYISGTRDILLKPPTNLPVEVLLRDVLGSLLIILILLLASILFWYQTRGREFPLRYTKVKAGEKVIEGYECEWLKIPKRLFFLHSMGLVLGLAAVFVVHHYVFKDLARVVVPK
jgi:hypothetical protein